MSELDISPELKRQQILLEIEQKKRDVHGLQNEIKALRRSMSPSLDAMIRAELGNQITTREDDAARIKEEIFRLETELSTVT